MSPPRFYCWRAVGGACEDTAMTEIVVRVGTAGDYEAMSAVFGGAMMFDPSDDELGRRMFEPERALVATDGAEVVGTTRALTRDLSVPGAVVPAAHVTGVGVRATHRRRGVMSELIGRQLREVPEAIAVLWASEAGIYGRFGYSAAAWGVSYEVDLHRVGAARRTTRPGELSELTADEAAKELPQLLRSLQERRPGLSGRSELAWQRQPGGQEGRARRPDRAPDPGPPRRDRRHRRIRPVARQDELGGRRPGQRGAGRGAGRARTHGVQGVVELSADPGSGRDPPLRLRRPGRAAAATRHHPDRAEPASWASRSGSG